jgi:hypothetical protein
MIGDQNIKTKGGNPNIKYPPNARQAIPFSRPGVGYNGGPLVDSWAEAPPGGGTYVLASVGGTIQWLETEACDE